jgi:hypothetical protein
MPRINADGRARAETTIRPAMDVHAVRPVRVDARSVALPVRVADRLLRPPHKQPSTRA